MKTHIIIFVLLLCMVAYLPAGCDSGDSGEPVVLRFKLERFKDCDELLKYFQEEAKRVMEEKIDQQVSWTDGSGRADKGAEEPAAMNDDVDYDATGDQEGGDTGSDDGASESPEHSDTNIQEEGVDEADIVKTDGDYIYLVTGSFFVVVKSWPAEQTWETGRLRIPDGQPTEMFIYGDLAVIFSEVWNHEMPDSEWPDVEAPSARYGRFMKVSIVDLSDRTKPAFIREVYLEGTYVSSRMVDGVVRLVVASTFGGPDIDEYVEYDGYYYEDGMDSNDYKQMAEDKKAENRAKIDSSSLEDWIPRAYEKGDVRKSADFISECSAFYRPTEYSGNGVLSVLSFDLDDPQKKQHDVSVVSTPGVVYASQEALYVVTQPIWGYEVLDEAGMTQGTGDEVARSPEPAPAPDDGTAVDSGDADEGKKSRVVSKHMALTEKKMAITEEELESTAIHKFDIKSRHGEALYVASGAVFGEVLNQFSMSEYKGHLRLGTTTEGWATGQGRMNHLFVLRQSGEELEVVGSVRGLEPGESIYAMRFMGDRGFMVTYQEMDPLITFDLSNPAKPKAVGELHIPGFSTYLHPVDDNHLIGIGRETTSWSGVKLSLFDVTDFSNPRETHKWTYGSGEVESEALYDHHAFLYYSPLKMLALPFNTMWDWDDNAIQGVKVFNVDADKGFDEVAEIDHGGFYADYQSDYYAYRVRRSLVIENYIYSISTLGMKVNDMDSDFEEVASIGLPGVYGGDYEDEPPEDPWADGGMDDDGGIEEDAGAGDAGAGDGDAGFDPDAGV